MSATPGFVIAGAAKCGTTALFEYLSGHPAVFMPRIKEPKYFCSDLRTTGGVYTLDAYEALFAAAPAGCLTGEASAMYLYSKVAIGRLMAHNPRARIIVMLRHPVEAAHSLHAARCGYGHENIEDFEVAWRQQEARLAGRHLPPGWPDAATLQYGAIYRYATQVRRVLELVPPPQRHVILYEEFFAAPRRHYAEVLRFLGLAPDARTRFPVINPAIVARSRRLERVLRRPPRWLRAAHAPAAPLLRACGLRPARLLRRLNSAPRRKAALRPQFRSELERYFADDVAELESLLGRRLWHQEA